eukprot:GGOE01049201.1.p1 GENE.GGOE01049201.1~~GGOE01049201.1.p1  ORF type:complete len:157 (+),score=19.23 GGOE01049201.1:32-472(+)
MATTQPGTGNETECLACFCCYEPPVPPRGVEDKRIVRPSKEEPKVHFANERTFLHWLSCTVLLSTMGVRVLKTESAGPFCVAAAYACLSCSVLFMIYALLTFYGRQQRIKAAGRVRFDDVDGPLVLTIVLMMGMAVVAVTEMGFSL